MKLTMKKIVVRIKRLEKISIISYPPTQLNVYFWVMRMNDVECNLRNYLYLASRNAGNLCFSTRTQNKVILAISFEEWLVANVLQAEAPFELPQSRLKTELLGRLHFVRTLGFHRSSSGTLRMITFLPWNLYNIISSNQKKSEKTNNKYLDYFISNCAFVNSFGQ